MIHGFRLKRGWVFVLITALIAGVIIGAMYAAKTGTDTDAVLNNYLNGYFQTLPEQNNYFQIFKNALWNNLRIFILLCISGLFRFGPIVIVGSITAKGFISGFTTAAIAKFYGARGLLISLCSMPATALTLSALLFYGIFAASFAGEREKREKNQWPVYWLISFFCLTIFCICAFADGYLTTTFMKLASKNVVGI